MPLIFSGNSVWGMLVIDQTITLPKKFYHILLNMGCGGHYFNVSDRKIEYLNQAKVISF